MIKIFTDLEDKPDDYSVQNNADNIFFYELINSGILTEPIVAQLLWDMEKTELLNPYTLKTEDNHILGWQQTAHGFRMAILQYYLCSDYNTLQFKACTNIAKCGENVIDFMMLHPEYFDKVPMYMPYCGLIFNNWDRPDILLNGTQIPYQHAISYLCERFVTARNNWDGVKYFCPEYLGVETRENVKSMFI